MLILWSPPNQGVAARSGASRLQQEDWPPTSGKSVDLYFWQVHSLILKCTQDSLGPVPGPSWQQGPPVPRSGLGFMLRLCCPRQFP